MKNKRKYEDSATAATDVAKKRLKQLKKISRKPDTPTMAEIKGKVAAFVEDRKQANNLVDVMGYLGI
jgi:hypothetical protein